MRKENLPLLSDHMQLDKNQISYYQENGHVLIREVADKNEVNAYREIMRKTLREFFDEKRQMQTNKKIDSYNSYFTQVTNLWQKNDVIKQFIFAERFAKVAADLMKVEGVRLYHDQGLFKEPGGKPTPWHQDQYYWPVNSNNTITMWMPLVDVSEEMGTMCFASGSQKYGYFGEKPISEDSDKFFDNLIKEKGFNLVSNPLKAGDATFHSGWTLHSSFANKSSQTREVITIIYYQNGVTILNPDNKHRQVDMEVFFPGLKPGDKAATELNPLLYNIH